MKHVFGFVVLLGLGTSQAAFAHGIWLAERHGVANVVYGHGADDDPYDPNKLTKVEALDAEGKSLPVEIERHDDHATLDLPENAAVVIMAFDNGYWTEREDGSWVNEPKSAVADAKTAGRFLKDAVVVLGPTESMPVSPEARLQILPLADPSRLHVGDDLPVQVFLDGQPYSGIELIGDYVNLGSEIMATTDAKGEAMIEIRNEGLNVIAAEHAQPLADDPDADERGYFATLSFTLPHEGD